MSAARPPSSAASSPYTAPDRQGRPMTPRPLSHLSRPPGEPPSRLLPQERGWGDGRSIPPRGALALPLPREGVWGDGRSIPPRGAERRDGDVPGWSLRGPTLRPKVWPGSRVRPAVTSASPPFQIPRPQGEPNSRPLPREGGWGDGRSIPLGGALALPLPREGGRGDGGLPAGAFHGKARRAAPLPGYRGQPANTNPSRRTRPSQSSRPQGEQNSRPLPREGGRGDGGLPAGAFHGKARRAAT